MDILVELLKITVGLLVIAGCISYWWDGFPPHGKGRWRRVLSDLEGRDPPSRDRRRTGKTSSTLDQRNGNRKRK